MNPDQERDRFTKKVEGVLRAHNLDCDEIPDVFDLDALKEFMDDLERIVRDIESAASTKVTHVFQEPEPLTDQTMFVDEEPTEIIDDTALTLVSGEPETEETLVENITADDSTRFLPVYVNERDKLTLYCFLSQALSPELSKKIHTLFDSFRELDIFHDAQYAGLERLVRDQINSTNNAEESSAGIASLLNKIINHHIRTLCSESWLQTGRILNEADRESGHPQFSDEEAITFSHGFCHIQHLLPGGRIQTIIEGMMSGNRDCTPRDIVLLKNLYNISIKIARLGRSIQKKLLKKESEDLV